MNKNGQDDNRTSKIFNPDVLVLGGGLAGLQTAIDLANPGSHVTIIERTSNLGGHVNQLFSLYNSAIDPRTLISEKLKDLEKNNDIEVITNAELVKLDGFAGDFTATIKVRSDNENIMKCIGIGAVIVATGYKTSFSNVDYGIQASENIITLLQLEDMLINNNFASIPQEQNICFYLTQDATKISCGSVLNDAIFLKHQFGSNVFVFFNDMKVYDDGLEELYLKAQDNGVRFIRCLDTNLEFIKEKGTAIIRVKDQSFKDIGSISNLEIPYSMLIIPEKIMPTDSYNDLRSILQIGLGPDNFFQVDNVNLTSVESNRRGIFTVGGCRGIRDISGTIMDARNAVLKTLSLLISSSDQKDHNQKAKIDPDKCTLCLTCIRTCPHVAICIEPQNRTAKVVDIACYGCGICTGECPTKAIELQGYSDEQISKEIGELV